MVEAEKLLRNASHGSGVMSRPSSRWASTVSPRSSSSTLVSTTVHSLVIAGVDGLPDRQHRRAGHDGDRGAVVVETVAVPHGFGAKPENPVR